VTGADSLLSGPVGPFLAILVMMAATYGCRVGGVLLMRHVRLTPTIERALAALPGAIVAATVVPLALRSGPVAVAGIAAGILTMVLTGKEIVALLVGLGLVAGARAFGF
jgi:uncharacterized membrane protein